MYNKHFAIYLFCLNGSISQMNGFDVNNLWFSASKRCVISKLMNMNVFVEFFFFFFFGIFNQHLMTKINWIAIEKKSKERKKWILFKIGYSTFSLPFSSNFFFCVNSMYKYLSIVMCIFVGDKTCAFLVPRDMFFLLSSIVRWHATMTQNI